jgi:hypothetical protein
MLGIMARWRQLCLLFLAPALVAAGPSFVGQSAKWYNSNYESVQRVLRSKQDPNVVPYIHALGSLYEFREGSIGAEVSPAIGVALTYHPALMLSWFQAHPTVFEQWLERVQFDLLTDYKGTEAKHLERMRVELVASLRKFESESKDAVIRELAVRARKGVELVKVRAIE